MDSLEPGRSGSRGARNPVSAQAVVHQRLRVRNRRKGMSGFSPRSGPTREINDSSLMLPVIARTYSPPLNDPHRPEPGLQIWQPGAIEGEAILLAELIHFLLRCGGRVLHQRGDLFKQVL